MAGAVKGPRRDLFGDIAVGKGLLTWAQVRDALKRQLRYKTMGIEIRIGEVAVEMGLLSQPQCSDILSEQREKRRAAQEAAPAAEVEVQDWDDDSGQPYEMGPYRIDKRLGGVMGIVFRAVDTRSNQTIAIKVLPKSLATSQAAVERFKREVRATGTLNHPNIITIWDSGVLNHVFYLSMEYVDGETLARRLRHERVLSERDAAHIARDVALALEHAHGHGVLHRDVKPENIMISTAGQVKLADLGLAKFLQDESRITASGIAVGTPHYISPEQARALADTDHRADIYSLGATLFHMVTGRLPYEGDDGAEVMRRHVFEAVPNPRAARPEVSQPMSDFIMKMMAKDPARRQQSAKRKWRTN